jgi:hypothetical protein
MKKVDSQRRPKTAMTGADHPSPAPEFFNRIGPLRSFASGRFEVG